MRAPRPIKLGFALCLGAILLVTACTASSPGPSLPQAPESTPGAESPDSGIGGPTSSSAPSPTSQPVGGQFTYSAGFGNVLAVDIDASSDGSSLSGTAVVRNDGETLFTVELQCLRRFDDQTWMLAGAITPEPVGQDLIKWWAVIVRDGSPQLVGTSGEAATNADDCEEFVSEIPDSEVTGSNIEPMLEGRVTLPPAPPAN